MKCNDNPDGPIERFVPLSHWDASMIRDFPRTYQRLVEDKYNSDPLWSAVWGKGVHERGRTP